MADKILFEGTHNATPQDSRRIPIGYAGIEGSEYVEVSELADQTLNEVVNIKFAPQNTLPTFGEGKLFYDNNKKALSYYNEESDVSVNIGQELLFRVYNSSGATIANGKVVTPVGSTIALANCYDKHKSRLLAVATHDIENNTWGYVTKFGQVGGLDTSSYSAGDVIYLGSNGEFTTDTPIDGGYICIVGVVDEVSATVGVITVDTKSSDTTVEVTDTNGFPTDQRTASTISFVDGTRTFSIVPTGSAYHFYELGDKYEKTANINLVIANTTGVHIIYFDGGTLTEGVNLSGDEIEQILLFKCIVALVYWNATAGYATIFQDERHGLMPPVTHVYLHERFGAFWRSGLTLNNVVLNGNGSSNTHAQFGTAIGTVKDEDLPHDLIEVGSTAGLTYIYQLGSTGEFYKGTNAGYSFPVGATPLPQYNLWNGSTWSLAEATSRNFINIHVFGNGATDRKPIVRLGIAQYGSQALAEAGQADELTTILGNLPAPEFVLLHSLVLECKTTFTNSVNARYVAQTDWRITELSAGSTPGDHNTLANLQLAGTGVDWGHVNEALYNQIIASNPTNRTNPTVSANAITFDWASKNVLIATKSGGGGIDVATDATVTLSNTTNADQGTIYLDVTANSVLTFPANVVSSDTRWNTATQELALLIGWYTLVLRYDRTNFRLSISDMEG